MRNLMDKKIVLGISGGIAAYKIATLASMLVKEGAQVKVIMTENATKFIGYHTFEALTHNKCMVDTFDRGHSYDVEHVEIAKEADCILIAPATANVIGKMACGIGDNLLLTTVLAAKCPVMIAPAMNTNMFENTIVQENLSKLKYHGIKVIDPVRGYLACGDVGLGKMAEPEELYARIVNEIAFEKDLLGKKILITAGATKEAIDPVRYITNHSTGRMGFALAKAAKARGAYVKLITGETNIEKPNDVDVITIKSAEDLYLEVMKEYEAYDVIIKSAAVADYTPQIVYQDKMKKQELQIDLKLKKTKDILQELGEKKREGQILCGFAMETENLIDNANLKFKKKHLDLLVANDLKVPGGGFASTTNVASIITKDDIQQLELMTKDELSHKILDKVLTL